MRKTRLTFKFPIKVNMRELTGTYGKLKRLETKVRRSHWADSRTNKGRKIYLSTVSPLELSVNAFTSVKLKLVY